MGAGITMLSRNNLTHTNHNVLCNGFSLPSTLGKEKPFNTQFILEDLFIAV